MQTSTETSSPSPLSPLIDAIDGAVRFIGRVVCWANGLLVLVIMTQVVLRFGFGRGQVFLEELQWHLYSLGIMFGASYAVVVNSHVRVDIFHEKFSQRKKDIVEILGILFFFLPFIYVVASQSIPFVADSWRVGEHSDAPMGLPFRWLIKSVIPISFTLLGLAGITRLIRCFLSLRRG